MTTLDARREALMARLAELDSRMHAIEAELDQPASKDWEEAAVEQEDDEVLEALGEQSRTEVRRIRAALDRIRRGEYGYCVECGTEIAPERLDLLPATPFCAACAANH
ncbi:TraR/DksA family transcriptional regulator [Rhodosalinus sediminis]|jgi:RNA polymerase-binding transcription factor DksA|uniref:TraR/DksA family transcriptional regulator n=1 Tax=Rhodosalinus sediminis TaxID=1940533 RepID=A0A3D9BSZ6_9RHOB|nr:TraR/DksA family transcriptional regulator [Rhodosalinus sediminis]REC56639.1 TraR/DksA family transcriptional regulator [Rhodosalinus sediminis]